MKVQNFFAILMAMFLFDATLAPLRAQKVKVAEVTILPPVLGQKPHLTDGQIAVGAEEVYHTPLNGSMVAALKAAKSRGEQEAAVLRFITPELRQKFEVMNRENPELFKPEDFTPMTSEEEALQVAASKQSFTDFTHWGSSPFGKPAKSWKDLRDHFTDYMDAVIKRTTYAPEMKAEWYDRLHECLQKGPDGKYCQEVNIQDWPLWQWTTGRMQSRVTEAMRKQGKEPGVNLRYKAGPAKGLLVVLARYGIVVIHGYECRGNPIVPFIGSTTFRMTKSLPPIPESAKPEQCKCSIVTAKDHLPNQAEVYPDTDIELEAKVEGDVKLQFQQEVWYVNGMPKLTNQRRFNFRPKDFDYKTGIYNVEFQLTDQWGRTSVCKFTVVISPKPPEKVTYVPPAKVEKIPPPEEGGGCGKWCWIVPIVGGIAAGVIIAALHGGGKSSVPNPIEITKPGITTPGPASVGAITFSWGAKH